MVGLIGSGKDTAADYLVSHHKFVRDSFASTLKDAVSAVFGWNRELLEGKTVEARQWREEQDAWWSNRLNMHITPRKVLQQWGTDVCRAAFHNDIWIASLEHKLKNSTNNIVISDVRFPNEIAAIRNAGGIVVRIKRGPDPAWFAEAKKANCGCLESRNKLQTAGIHSSETSWIGCKTDYEVTNNSSVTNLYAELETILCRVKSLS